MYRANNGYDATYSLGHFLQGKLHLASGFVVLCVACSISASHHTVFLVRGCFCTESETVPHAHIISKKAAVNIHTHAYKFLTCNKFHTSRRSVGVTGKALSSNTWAVCVGG